LLPDKVGSTGCNVICNIYNMILCYPLFYFSAILSQKAQIACKGTSLCLLEVVTLQQFSDILADFSGEYIQVSTGDGYR